VTIRRAPARGAKRALALNVETGSQVLVEAPDRKDLVMRLAYARATRFLGKV